MLLCLLQAFQPAAAQTVSEQEFVDFLARLTYVPTMAGRQAKADSLTSRYWVQPQQLDTVLDYAAKYLLDRRSPLYAPVAYDSLFVMDRPGHRLPDFNFKDTLGRVSSLYALMQADTLCATEAAEAPLTLFFYSADCDHCLTLLRQWQQTPSAMPSRLNDGHVLAVCLNEDDNLWKASLSLLPKHWTPVRDQDNLLARRRYDLRQLPHVVGIKR